jgi:uncharacterized protein (TIGR00290 family)
MKRPVVFCWSGGKDSALALYELRQSPEFEVVALLTTVTREFDRISMHGVRRELLHRQAELIGLPVDEVWINPGASNAEYEAQMERQLRSYALRGIGHLAFGDIFLEDLREYRERNLAKVGMHALFPIWQRDTHELIYTFLQHGFRSITCCIDRRVLADEFAGRVIDEQFIDELPESADPCGENGEFHSFTFAGPLFRREIAVQPAERMRRDDFLYCDLIPEANTPT